MKQILCLLVVVLFTGHLYSQSPDISKPVLKKTDVENFIKNFKTIQAELDEVGLDYQPESDYQSLTDAISNVGEINAIVKKYGYSDINDFSLKAWAIAASYATIKLDSDGQSGLKEAIDQIRNDENLTNEQKEDAINKLKEMMGSIESAFVIMANKEDVETVRPFVDKLELVLED